MPKRPRIRDSDLWFKDIRDRGKASFNGYEVVLTELWDYPRENVDNPDCNTGIRDNLDGATEVIAYTRTLVPSYAIDLVECRLDMICRQFPESRNRYTISVYHSYYFHYNYFHKGDYQRKRNKIYEKTGRVGGRKYESGIRGWDADKCRIVTDGTEEQAV